MPSRGAGRRSRACRRARGRASARRRRCGARGLAARGRGSSAGALPSPRRASRSSSASPRRRRFSVARRRDDVDAVGELVAAVDHAAERADHDVADPMRVEGLQDRDRVERLAAGISGRAPSASPAGAPGRSLQRLLETRVLLAVGLVGHEGRLEVEAAGAEELLQRLEARLDDVALPAGELGAGPCRSRRASSTWRGRRGAVLRGSACPLVMAQAYSIPRVAIPLGTFMLQLHRCRSSEPAQLALELPRRRSMRTPPAPHGKHAESSPCRRRLA